MKKDIIVELNREGFIEYVYEYKELKPNQVEKMFKELVKSSPNKSYVWYDLYYRKVKKSHYVK